MNKIKKQNKNRSTKKSMMAALSLLIGLFFLLTLQGCPSPVVPITDPIVPMVNFNTNVVTSGAGRIFADAEALTNVGVVAVPADGVGKNSAGGADALNLNFTNNVGEGAGGSDNYLIVSETAANSAGAWGIVLWTLDGSFSMTNVNNTSFSMYVRSSDAVVNSIALKVEDTDAAASEVAKTFTADGTWQKVTWSSAELAGAANLGALSNIVIVFNTALDSTTDQVVIGIDEVQFEVLSEDQANQSAVAAAKAALEIVYAAGDSATLVTANLTLATDGADGVGIAWASSDTNVIATDGVVTRAGANTDVTLTATLTKGTVTDTKVFMVSVLLAQTDVQAVAAAKAALEIVYAAGDSNINVTANLTLAPAGADGVVIAWASDNGAIGASGVVTRGETNIVVMLTATLTKGSTASDTKVFMVTVIAAPSPSGAAIIFADAAALASVEQINVSDIGTYGGDGAGALTLTVNSNDGDGSSEHLNVQESGDGAGAGFAGFSWPFSDNYNLTAVTNTAVKFSVRVATGGPTSFGVALETTGASGDARPWQARKPVTFTADGTWQQVTIPASNFTSISNRDINSGGGLFRGNNFDPSTIQAVVFSLDEAVTASSTAINIDIDEVQFIVQ